MKLSKTTLYWGAGGLVILAVVAVGLWFWFGYTPYDESNPDVQKQLEMIAQLRQDIKDNKSFVSAYVQIGYIYEQLGDDRRALATYKKLARLRPKSSPPFIALGQYYSDKKKYTLAEKNLLIAAKNDPGNVAIYQDLSFLYSYGLKGNDDKFEAMILDAVNQHPEIKPNLIQILAFYFKEINNKDKARTYLNQLIELVPDNRAAWQQSLDELNAQ